MTPIDKISSKLEDYLETILALEKAKQAARVRDIATLMSVHKSTVTAALKNLADKGLINYTPYEIATLTDEGRSIAEEISLNHGNIRNFLARVLLVEDGEAEENACRMEHVMDRNVLDRLVFFARFVEDCPEVCKEWMKDFADYVQSKKHIGSDSTNRKQFLKDFRKELKRLQEEAARDGIS